MQICISSCCKCSKNNFRPKPFGTLHLFILGQKSNTKNESNPNVADDKFEWMVVLTRNGLIVLNTLLLVSKIFKLISEKRNISERFLFLVFLSINPVWHPVFWFLWKNLFYCEMFSFIETTHAIEILTLYHASVSEDKRNLKLIKDTKLFLLV